ncbi:uroporphyrinogen decarboxylase family protein [Desulfitibacter alkalitolerans]|uniref:uroporphyrinogen decarboxylase family protein n=1 Tax=Desulfitibacter alkalitolerans TaxID=264641 RepID=UPI00048685B1|nr:uroporphyrinogen decarboxylase family protein [Desulfitibacter alkalitolerans]
MKTSMTSRERVMTALKLKEPDQVPFAESAIDEVLQVKLMGRDDFTPDELCELLGLDAFGYEYPSGGIAEAGEVIKSGTSHEGYHNPQKITFDFIPPWIAEMEHGVGGRNFIKKGLIRDESSLSLMDEYLPDPHDQRRYEKVANWIAKYKKDYAVFARIRIGPAPVINSIGFEELCYMIYDNPSLVKEVHRRYSEWTAQVVKYLNEMDFDFFWAADDIADNKSPWFSPSMFREFFLPYMKIAADEIKKPWIFHSDGNLFPVLDELLTLGMNGIHPIQPSAMDIGRMKADYGSKVCIVGNIDLDYTLTRGTPEETDAEVKERIRTIGPKGGYIVSSANSLASYVLPENALALGKAVKKYGRYPITVE